MATPKKAGPSRGFRPRGQVEERIEHAEQLRLNISEIVNAVLEKHLSELDKVIEEKKAELRKLLDSPLRQ